MTVNTYNQYVMTQAAFVGIVKENHVLLVKSLTNPRFSNHWSLPGGLVDAGETPDMAAKREAVEEVGIHCSIDRLIAEIDNIEDDLEVFIYHGTYISGDITVLLDELADARWFTIEEALELPLAYAVREHLLELF